MRLPHQIEHPHHQECAILLRVALKSSSNGFRFTGLEIHQHLQEAEREFEYNQEDEQFIECCKVSARKGEIDQNQKQDDGLVPHDDLAHRRGGIKKIHVQ